MSDLLPPPPPPARAAGPSKPGIVSRRSVPNWAVATIAAVALLLGVGAGAASPSEEAATTTTTQLTTTTTIATTTTKPKPTTTLKPTTTTAPQPIQIGHWAGSNDTQTQDFTVTGTWTITARVSGGAGIAVEAYPPGADPANDVSTESVEFQSGTNTSTIRTGGTFFLDISTFGATYDVTVTDVPG